MGVRGVRDVVSVRNLASVGRDCGVQVVRRVQEVRDALEVWVVAAIRGVVEVLFVLHVDVAHGAGA